MQYDIHEKIFVQLPDGHERLISDVFVARGISGTEEAARWVALHYTEAEPVEGRTDWWEIRDGRLIFRWALEWDRDLLRTSGGQAGSPEALLEQYSVRNEALRKWMEHTGAKPPFEGQVIECHGDKGEYYKFVYQHFAWMLEEFIENIDE